MRIADSRVFGIFPLQHKGYKDNSPPWDLDKRSSIFGVRILDRLDGPNQAGHWKYDDDSVGDIHGGQLFQKDDKKRPVPMWRFATGVVVTRPPLPVATVGNNREPVATPSSSTSNAPVATPSPSTRDFRSPAGGAGQVTGAPGEGDRSVGGEAPGGTPGSGVLNGTTPTISQVPTHSEGGYDLVYSPSSTSSQPGGWTYSPNTVTGANPLSAPGGPLGAVDPTNRLGSGSAPTEPTGGSAVTPNALGTIQGTAGTGVDLCQPITGAFEVAPILDENYGPDLRLKKLKPEILKAGNRAGMSRPAIGSLGITLTANEENRQIDLFFPTDNRLIAVNYAGDVRCGSLVCDLTPNSEIDPLRMAPLQALTWVIKRPSGGPNSLAWNIGPTGCRDTEGGLVIDDPDGSATAVAPVATPSGGNPPVATPSGGRTIPASAAGPGSTQVMPGDSARPREQMAAPNIVPGGSGKRKVVAWASRHHNGPLDVGTGRCRHWTGDMDDDGHPIVPLHIQWQFLLRQNDQKDGPLNITKYKEGQDFDKVAKVYMGWNAAIKKWDWWTTVPIYYCPYPPMSPAPPVPMPPLTPLSPVEGVPRRIDLPGIATPTPNPGPSAPMGPIGSPSNPIRTTDKATDLGSLFGTGTVATGGDVGKPDPPGTGDGPLEWPTGVPVKPWTPPGTPPSTPPPPPSDDPPRVPGAGSVRGSGWYAPGYEPDLAPGNVMSPASAFNQGLPFLMGSLPLGTQSTLAKPINYTTGKPNASNTAATALGDDNASPAQQAAVAGPVTGAMVAYAGEGGVTGAGGYTRNTGASGDPWKYNQMPGQSRYPCGTGPGGWCIIPPESDMVLARTSGLVPPHVTTSTVYFLVGPGAYFGAGVPELGDGTMKDGYVWGFESTTGDLVWYTHSNSQTKAEAMRFVLASQNYRWMSGGSFYGEFDHSNTGNRVYSFPDLTASVELFQLVSADPNGVTSGKIGTLAWDQVGMVMYANNDGATGWTALAGGGGGSVTGSGAATRIAFWTSASNLSSSANLYWDNTNFRLGAGTNLPRRRIDSLDTANPQVRLTYSDNTVYAELQADSSGNLAITTTGTFVSYVHSTNGNPTRFVLQNSSNTASSDMRLEVLAGGISGGNAYVMFGDNIATYWSIGYNNGSADEFQITPAQTLNGATAYFTILVGGNTGVGTTTPRRKFDALDAGGNAQLRLTYTDNTVYTDIQTNSSGNTVITNTGAIVGYEQAKVGGNLTLRVINSDNTNPASVGRFVAGVGGASAGDPVIVFDIAGVTDWTVGADNSDGDKFKINPSASLGTNDLFTLSTLGDAVLNSAKFSSGNLKIFAAAGNGLVLDTTGASQQNQVTFNDNAVNKWAIYKSSAHDLKVYNYNLAADALTVLAASSNVGILTTSPRRRLDVLDASNPQLRLTYTDNTVYTEQQTDSSGNLNITMTGGRVGVNVATVSTSFGTFQVNRQSTYNSEAGGAICAVNDATSPNKVVSIGYDNVLDAGFIYSFHSGTAIKPLVLNASNVGIGSTYEFGGGAGVLYLKDGTAPTSDPTSGVILYSEAGVLKVRTPSGIYTLTP